MPKVLTVEDNPTTRAILASALRDRGHEVLEAEHGKAAIDILKDNEIEIILLDIHMPVMDGPELLSELKRAHPEIPVVLLSGKRDLNRIKACMDLGAIQYLHKPVDINVLHEVVTDIAGAGNTEAVSAHWGTMLVVSEDEVTSSRIRELLPQPIKIEFASSMRLAAEASARHRFRTIIIDNTFDQGARETAKIIRENQAEAIIFALYEENHPEPAEEAWTDGFEGFLSKPVTPEPIDYLLGLIGYYHFELECILDVDEGLLTPLPYDGFHATLERYYSHLAEKIGLVLQELSIEGYEDVILDCSELPESPLRLILAQTAIEYCSEEDLGIRLVGDRDMWKAVQEATSGVTVQIFSSVDEALDEE